MSIQYKIKDDGKHFYEINWTNRTYLPITEAEFYKKSSYKKKDIQNLFKSVYPTQGNDYLLLKHEGQLFPVDYKLVPLVQYLWNRGIKTMGWNQPDESTIGFVSMEYTTKKNESTIDFLQSILLNTPFKVIHNLETKITYNSIVKQNKEIEKLVKKGFIVLGIESNFVSISMNDSLLKKLYDFLGLQMNEERLPGAAVFWGDLKDHQLKKATK